MAFTILVVLLFATTVIGQGNIGQQCTHSLQCGRGAFCHAKICRKDGCTVSSQCEKGELCEYGLVNGRRKTACFPAPLSRVTTEDYCPGGGAVVVNFDGKLSTCSLEKPCGSSHVCNPQNGICCTKLRTCPKPAKVVLDTHTQRPIICQIRFGMELPCPSHGYCETKTGFCCQKSKEEKPDVPAPVATRPWRGQVCTPNIGCDGGAACICASRANCRCECPTEFGYSVSSDGKTCQRLRRRLKEKCKTDMECSAAFSECATGGCRCKQGFQRDGNGGCKPIKHKCIGNATPLTKDEKIVTCHMRSTLALTQFSDGNVSIPLTSDNNETEIAYAEWNDRDSCPEGNYCVPVFDDAQKPGFYQGFCCPSPGDIKPVCPVGEPHETSFYPDFGCKECPSDYYCHRDGVITDKTICCPKPCVSLEDIYHEGQCYSTAFYGDSCHISAQCTSQKAADGEDEHTEIGRLECTKGICDCPAGFSHSQGQCKRIMCTIGLRGEPAVDRFNQLIRCSRSSDCSQGHMCDQKTHVCCKGNNRCPKEYVETGELCTESGICRGENHICHWPKGGKVKICCTIDDAPHPE